MRLAETEKAPIRRLTTKVAGFIAPPADRESYLQDTIELGKILPPSLDLYRLSQIWFVALLRL